MSGKKGKSGRKADPAGLRAKCAAKGVKYHTIYARMKRNKLTEDEAFRFHDRVTV
jgi:hypothetical protein